ncbi:unnamed protein product [Arctogadus glacialis]
MPKGKGRKKAEKEEKDSKKESIWMVFKDWIKKTRRNEPIRLSLLSQCKRYFIKHVSNKKRDELEKTTALKKNREQIKLLADEIRLLKDEATLNKEQRKLTDLHTTLVRQGVIAAHPLDSGPSEGSDQGKGRGTLGGAYGRMLTTQIPPPVQHTVCFTTISPILPCPTTFLSSTTMSTSKPPNTTTPRGEAWNSD